MLATECFMDMGQGSNDSHSVRLKKEINYSLCQILKENAYISNKKFIERKENSFENRRTYIKNTVVTLMQ